MKHHAKSMQTHLKVHDALSNNKSGKITNNIYCLQIQQCVRSFIFSFSELFSNCRNILWHGIKNEGKIVMGRHRTRQHFFIFCISIDAYTKLTSCSALKCKMLYIKISCLISQFVISCHVATRYIKIIITSDEKDPYLYAIARKIHIYLQSASSLRRRYSMNDNHQGLVLKILTPFLNIMTKKNIFAVFF